MASTAYERARRRTHEILRIATPGDRTSRAVDVFLVVLILANLGAFVAESSRPLAERFGEAFAAFELLSVVIFSIEYVLRLWSCVEDPPSPGRLPPRLRHAMRPLMVVDLLAILPAFLPLLGIDLRVLRAFRLVRLLRLLKLSRYFGALQVLGHAVRARHAELLATISLLALLELVAACLMYVAEREAQPEAFSSVPAAAWWAIATLTTVGYGDVAPITPGGRMLAGVIAVLGVLVVALPTAILGASFVEQLEVNRRRRPAAPTPVTCPHCGGDLGGA